MKTSQTEHARNLIASMHVLDARASELQRTADTPAFEWQPPEGGWSAGQVFEHLCVANDSYLVQLRRVLGTVSATSRDAVDRSWRPSLAGRLLARSMESPRKLPAPKMWRPAPVPRPNVIGEFLTRQREIEQLIQASMAHDWRRLRLASPISKLIRMNVGDAFTVLVRHAERHFRQIDSRLAAYAARRERPASGGSLMAGDRTTDGRAAVSGPPVG
jgi:hypothetical protein